MYPGAGGGRGAVGNLSLVTIGCHTPLVPLTPLTPLPDGRLTGQTDQVNHSQLRHVMTRDPPGRQRSLLSIGSFIERTTIQPVLTVSLSDQNNAVY